MYNVLKNMLCRKDVLNLIDSFRELAGTKDDNEELEIYLDTLRDGIDRMTYWNVIEAGDINIIVENLDGFKEFLDNQADRG